MRIREITAYRAHVPLKNTIRHASHTRDASDSLIVCCRFEDGTCGWGEGLPRPYVTGETIETALAQLRETDLAAQLGGRIEGLADAVDRARRLRIAAPSHAARDCFGNAARCAVELSLLDAVARRVCVPLSTVAQHVPEAASVLQHRDRVQYSGAITPMGTLRETLRAWLMRLYGFRQAKVKVGVAGVDDVRALARVRKWVGPGMDLRIDANEAWSCNNLEAKLAPLLRFRITAVEQPVPHEAVEGLAAIRPRLGLPIMLDESLCSLSDAERAIAGGTCDLFNIRLSKCGGFVNSLRLAAIARGAGLGYQLGCQVGETGILSAAGRHFACSVGGIRYLEGSYDRFLVRERLTREDVTFGRGGWAAALGGPGLGVNVDRDALRRVTRAAENWRIDE